MEDGDSGSLFGDVVFSLIPSDDLDRSETDDIIAAIESNGGRYIALKGADRRIDDLDSLTHIISLHIDFPQYANALEAGVYVVKPSWAAQSIRKRRQAGPRQHSPDPSQFFQDVVLSCADLPAGDIDAITAGVIAMGGQFSGPLTKLVTHIATLSLEHDKCRIAQAKELDCMIVLPHWFDDCLRLGKKINERPYTFPHPELLRNVKSPIKGHSSQQLQGATSARPEGALPQVSLPSPSKSRKKLNAFAAKKIFLSDDLQLGDRLLQTLASLVQQGGGSLASSVDNADIYIGQYRDGTEYIRASQAGKEVANLAWLYHVINQNTYTSPLGKLLHYPIPRNGIAGFENMKISVSNYSGDARVYLENLITYCGAEYTKTMKQDNTHLITAHMQSEKCEAAQEWNINIINHLWLEESYIKCAVQTLSNPKYTHFPIRTNLSEVAGQTALDIKRLEHMYFPKPRSPQKVRSPLKQQTREVAPQPARLSVQPHTPQVEKAERHTAHAADAEHHEAADNASPMPVTEKKSRGRPRKEVATPKLDDNEKENELPSRVNTGRTSKTKALNNLHKQADDIALFQKEMKRKGGVVRGGRPSGMSEDPPSPAPAPRNDKKRPSDTFDESADVTASSDGEEEQTVRAKASKRSKQAESTTSRPTVQVRMMVTGDERWQGKPSKESSDKNKLRMLGILLVQEAKNVQVLVAPKILRTKKFVAALACAPLVVNTDYLDMTLSENRLIEDPKPLSDREAEKRFGFKLAESLERAKANKHRLLAGYSIYVTKDVNGGFETYQEIVAVNGGTAVLYQGRAGMIFPKTPHVKGEDETSDDDVDHDQEQAEFVYLVAGTSAAESKLGKAFASSAEKQGREARVVSTDWLLNAAMRQEVTWDESWAHNL